MSITVTIHNGEMGQIKHFLERKTEKGQLYGLWTHSNQPVVQYVIGVAKPEEQKKIARYLQSHHGIKHIGNWSTDNKADDQLNSDCLSFVKMTVKLSPSNKKTINVERVRVYQEKKELNGVVEILDGDSAFRLPSDGPFQGDKSLAHQYHNVKVDLVEVNTTGLSTDEVEVRKEQWYSTEEGMQLFAKIHGAIKQSGFSITGTSRSTETHDISITISIQGRGEFSVDFPVDFPKGKAFLKSLKGGQSRCIQLLEPVSTKGKTAPGNRKSKNTKAKGAAASPGKPSQTENKTSENQVTPNEPGTNESEADCSMVNEEDAQPPSPDQIAQLLVEGISRLAGKGTPV